MVKVSIISDLHLGFGKDTEREEDAFVATKRAFEKAKELESDLIILAGDMFDTRLPRPEHWSRFMKLLSIFRDGEGVNVIKNQEETSRTFDNGIPVIAIHGTHERRGKGMKNTVEALEDAGFLEHLHCDSLKLGIGDEKLGIHGMSGVPEQYSEEVLKKWDPEPFENAYNIFLIHQDLEPYIFNPANPPSLGLEDLPEGFDLYVSGHIHWRDKEEFRDGLFVIPGSLIPTQLRKREAEVEKGFYFLDTETKDIEFIDIDPPRKFFYKEVEIEDGSSKKVHREVQSQLEETVPEDLDKKPLVRIKVKGELMKGVSSNDIDLSPLKEEYEDKALLTLSVDLEEKGLEEKVETLRNLREEKLSVDEMGMKILREKVEETGASIDPDAAFEDLVQGNLDNAMEKLKEESKQKEEKTEGKHGDEVDGNEWWKES